jgi:Zn-dependent peptidase ImmA (M78 family)
MLSNLAFKRIENLALDIIAQSKITKPPIPVDQVAQKAGVVVTELEIGEDISGMLVISEGGAVIGINSIDVAYRKRFAIAHELGHFFLHKDKNQLFLDKDFLVKWRNPNSNSNYTAEEVVQEQEANAFAASLLIPKSYIEIAMATRQFKNLNENDLFTELAKLFAVSIPAIAFRMTNINYYYV